MVMGQKYDIVTALAENHYGILSNLKHSKLSLTLVVKITKAFWFQQ